MNRDDRVLPVVLAAEHLLGLARVDFPGEVVQALGEIVDDRFSRLRPFDQDAEIVGAPTQRVAQVLIVLEPAAALQQLLGGRLVLPEVRSRDAVFDAGELFGGAGGVKDGSAGRMPAWRDPDTGEAARRVGGSYLIDSTADDGWPERQRE
jgi:hypothetical protein